MATLWVTKGFSRQPPQTMRGDDLSIHLAEKKLFFQWGGSWKNCRSVGWYLETWHKFIMNLMSFFCAGFNNRHDLFMFIFYIFFFTFLPLIFFIWQNVTTMYGTWLARQMEHLQRNISVWVAVVPKILDLVISIAALGIEGCVEVWKCIYVDFEFWESIWVERSQVNTIS